jgi:hypothetical protein
MIFAGLSKSVQTTVVLASIANAVKYLNDNVKFMISSTKNLCEWIILNENTDNSNSCFQNNL